MKILKDTIIWDELDFIRGFVPMQRNSAVRILARGEAGASFMRDFDAFRTPGFAYPGYNGSDVGNVSVVDGVLVDSATDAAGTYSYAIGGSKLHRFDIINETLINGAPWPHSLAGAGAHGAHAGFSFSLGGVALYNVARVTKLFYAWNDATDWDVGMYDLASGFTDNFMSATPATPLGTTGSDLTNGVGHPHNPYVCKLDDMMYIPSGNVAHQFDGATGANGTFNRQIFKFPSQFECQGFAETGYDLVAFLCSNARSGRRGTAYAYFYNVSQAATDPYKTIFLDDDEVACPFNFGNTCGCFTRNRNSGRSVLRLWDGKRFAPKYYYTGGLPTVGGVEIQDNLIKWNGGGTQYVWGSKDGDFPEGKFQNFTGAGVNSGILKSFLSGNLYMSSGTTTTGGLQTFDTDYASTAFWQGLTAYPQFGPGRIGRVAEVSVTFAAPVSGGRALSLTLTTNGGLTTTTIFSNLQTITSGKTVLTYRNDSSAAPLPKFEGIRPNLLWSLGGGATAAPGVKQIAVRFELRNNA